MNKNRLFFIVFLILAIIGGGWYYYSTNQENNILATRAIPEKSEILKTIEQLTAGNADYQQQVDTLKRLCKDNPVDKAIITSRLDQAGLNVPDIVSIAEGQIRIVGQFKLLSWIISGPALTPDQLDNLLAITNSISHTTPIVNINTSDKIKAQITIFALSYDQPTEPAR